MKFQKISPFQAPANVVEEVVTKALDLGYRHIDTAFNYNNEEAIGNAVKKWLAEGKGKRSDLFITTKASIFICIDAKMDQLVLSSTVLR